MILRIIVYDLLYTAYANGASFEKKKYDSPVRVLVTANPSNRSRDNCPRVSARVVIYASIFLRDEFRRDEKLCRYVTRCRWDAIRIANGIIDCANLHPLNFIMQTRVETIIMFSFFWCKRHFYLLNWRVLWNKRLSLRVREKQDNSNLLVKKKDNSSIFSFQVILFFTKLSDLSCFSPNLCLNLFFVKRIKIFYKKKKNHVRMFSRKILGL